MIRSASQSTLFSFAEESASVSTADRPSTRTQLQRVVAEMKSGQWTTLAALAHHLRRRHPGTHFPEASLSARLRDMRRCGWSVERRPLRNGLFEYRAFWNQGGVR